jgi:hypothetical protein
MSSRIINSKKYIYELYKDSSYLDINSPFIILFFILILFLLFFISYINVIINTIPIKDDWENQRCNPSIMPFAGLINLPDDKTILEFTTENYNQCMKNVVKNVSSDKLEPFYNILSKTTDLFNSLIDIFNAFRQMFSFIKNQFKLFVLFVFLKISNVNISIQGLINRILNINGKYQGIFMSGAYLLDGGILLMRSTTGVVLNGIVSIIIGLGLLVLLLFSVMVFPLALAVLVTYLVFSILFILVTNNLSNILQVKLNIKK